MPENQSGDIQGKLVVHAIEEKAQRTPHHTYMRYPPADWETNGYKTITWRQYASTIDKVAHWLDEHLGKVTGSETVAYFGPNDPRYAILLPACIKTGRTVSEHTKSTYSSD